MYVCQVISPQLLREFPHSYQYKIELVLGQLFLPSDESLSCSYTISLVPLGT